MPDDPPIPDHAVYFGLFTEIGIINQLSRAVLEEQLPPDITILQFSVLNGLIRVRDGRTPQDLAIAFQVPKTTMTHTLAGLQAKGFVRLGPNPKDGRSKLVWITDPGRAFRNGVIADTAPRLAEIAPDFDRARVERLLPELAALRAILDRARDP